MACAHALRPLLSHDEREVYVAKPTLTHRRLAPRPGKRKADADALGALGSTPAAPIWPSGVLGLRGSGRHPGGSGGARDCSGRGAPLPPEPRPTRSAAHRTPATPNHYPGPAGVDPLTP